MTTPDRLCKQTIFYPYVGVPRFPTLAYTHRLINSLQTFSTLMKNGHLLATPKQPDSYTGPAHPDYIQLMDLKPDYVDLVAVHVETANGPTVRMSVLNRHPSADWEGHVRLDGFGTSSPRTLCMDDATWEWGPDGQMCARCSSAKCTRTTWRRPYVLVEPKAVRVAVP